MVIGYVARINGLGTFINHPLINGVFLGVKEPNELLTFDPNFQLPTHPQTAPQVNKGLIAGLKGNLTFWS